MADGRSAFVAGICGISKTGSRENNEDAFIITTIDDAVLLGVADGLGGHAAGETASRIAIDTLTNIMQSGYARDIGIRDVQSLLISAHEEAHACILAGAESENRGMGSTLVSACIRERHAVIANTGDSRAYVLGRGIRFQTRDHSVVASLVNEGLISREAARSHPMSNVITHSLGGTFGVDAYDVDLEAGETLLLSSDGMHDYIDEERLLQYASIRDCISAANALMCEALKTSKDNVTLVIYRAGN